MLIAEWSPTGTNDTKQSKTPLPYLWSQIESNTEDLNWIEIPSPIKVIELVFAAWLQNPQR